MDQFCASQFGRKGFALPALLRGASVGLGVEAIFATEVCFLLLIQRRSAVLCLSDA